MIASGSDYVSSVAKIRSRSPFPAPLAIRRERHPDAVRPTLR